MPVSQIDGRQVKPATLNSSHLQANAGITNGQLQNGSTYALLDGSRAWTANQSMGGFRITNLAASTVGTDAVNRNELDAAIAALNSVFDSKPSARCASTANVNLATPGTTFDTITPTSGQLILLLNQTASAENGLYVYTNGTTALTRHSSMDSWAEIPGALIAVEEGSVNGDRVFLCTANSGGTLGTTAITFQQINPNGLTINNFVFNEVPSGTINGTNPTFTLANTPVAGTLSLYANGVRQLVGTGNDYTISGNTITFLSGAIPVTGDQILADYIR